jgi:hypothetical protein
MLRGFSLTRDVAICSMACRGSHDGSQKYRAPVRSDANRVRDAEVVQFS